MLEIFRKLPPVFQKQIGIRLGVGLASLLMFVLLLVYYRSLYISFPLLLLSILFLVNGFVMLYNYVVGNYLKVEGVCTDVSVTGLRKRIKSLDILIGENTLHLPVHKRMPCIKNGDNVIIYMNDKTPVYEQGSKYVIYSYYALELKEE